MKKAISWLDENLEEFLMLILLALIAIIIMLQVIMRYVFQNALAWPEEFTRFCFVYTGCLSAGYCLRKGVGIRVDLLINLFPRPLKILIDILGKLATLFIYVLIFYNSFSLIATTSTLSTAMQLPMKYVYAGFPIGFGIGIIRCIQDLYKYFKSLKGGEQ